MSTVRALALSALFCTARVAQSCGYCDEDKVSAVYDHAVVARAAATHHEIVFLTFDPGAAGTPQREAAIRRAVAAAGNLPARRARLGAPRYQG